MRFISGSQNQRIDHRDTFDSDNLLTRGQEVLVDVDESLATEAILLPGQMSIHHGRIFHASYPNKTNERRIGLAIRYIPTNARQIPGSDMAAMLVRGEDKHQNFRLCNPPTGIMKEKDILFWSEISEVRNAIMMDS
jgi:ectoine hydroxylase-related dioxygenase (phytanoyl-CoA dioxygenase family)